MGHNRSLTIPIICDELECGTVLIRIGSTYSEPLEGELAEPKSLVFRRLSQLLLLGMDLEEPSEFAGLNTAS